jgi:hypothetical protein
MTIFTKYNTIPIYTTNNLGIYVSPARGFLNYTGDKNFVNNLNVIDFSQYGYASSLSIISQNGGPDLRNIIFTVVGINNGLNVVEHLVGPNTNNMVRTNNIFDKILSVSISADIMGNFSLTSGYDVCSYTEFSNPRYYNYTRPIPLCILNSPRANADIAAGSGMLIANLSDSAPFLTRATLTADIASKPIYYDLIKNGFTRAELNEAYRTAFGGNFSYNQVLFYFTNGVLTFPVFINFQWQN